MVLATCGGEGRSMTERAKETEPSRTAERHELSAKLDSVGWALFFMWVGIAFLADVGWGWGLLGVGIIILGEAAVRRYLALKIEGFWVVCGLMFLVGGLSELFMVPWPLVPILLILCGMVVLWGAVSGKHMMKK
jgi:hypothetical protein